MSTATDTEPKNEPNSQNHQTPATVDKGNDQQWTNSNNQDPNEEFSNQYPTHNSHMNPPFQISPGTHGTPDPYASYNYSIGYNYFNNPDVASWSTGDSFNYLQTQNYGGSDQTQQYMPDAMFGQHAQPQNVGFFYQSNDFGTWGSGNQGSIQHAGYNNEFSRYPLNAGGMGGYPMGSGNIGEMKGLERGVGGLNVSGSGDQDYRRDNKSPPNLPSSGSMKQKSWASVASQPAKSGPVKLKPKASIPPSPIQLPPQKNVNIESNWIGEKPLPMKQQRWVPRSRGNQLHNQTPSSIVQEPAPNSQHESSVPDLEPSALEQLKLVHEYNPKNFNLSPKQARFFVIKSYSEDDIHRSIKYNIWCSTEHGNKRLDSAFREEKDRQGTIYLFFSVNGSGHFCGIAQMITEVDYDTTSGVWCQDKWKGKFGVKWLYVKDVPNQILRPIKLRNNENKPVTNSRDTQEVPYEEGKQILKIINNYKHSTSIFDDFTHYEKRQEEEDHRKHSKGPGHPAVYTN